MKIIEKNCFILPSTTKICDPFIRLQFVTQLMLTAAVSLVYIYIFSPYLFLFLFYVNISHAINILNKFNRRLTTPYTKHYTLNKLRKLNKNLK